MRKYVWLFLIVLIAGFLRFYRLTEVPPALNSDEVAIGYNAYSILKTGRDEYGTRFPTTFRSFDDYKMPVYVYMVAGSIRVFGYNDFAVRFPSALFGTITVFLTYVLAKQLVKRRDIALVSAFLLAVSPWALQFSRSGYEANVAVFFVVLGVCLFLIGLKRSVMLVLSSIVFALAVWTYLTTRIFVPLLVSGFAVIYAAELWKKKFMVVLSLLIGIILVFPVIKMSLSAEGQLRAAGVSAFADSKAFTTSAARVTLDVQNGFGPLAFLNNRRWVYGMTFLRGYFSYFDPNFLFLDKSIDKYRAPGVGLLYLFELPLLLIGTYTLIRKWSKSSAVLFWWVLVAPVAASCTLPPPNPVRSLIFLPSFQIISAIGVLELKKSMRFILAAVCTVIVMVSVGYYFLQYFVHLPVEDAPYWYVGRKEMVKKLSSYENQYDRIIVSKYLDFPYIFFLYYRQTDPADYLKRGGTVSGGFTEERNTYGKYEFRSVDTSLQSGTGRMLFVGLPTEVFKGSPVVDTVYYPDGSPAIVFFR